MTTVAAAAVAAAAAIAAAAIAAVAIAAAIAVARMAARAYTAIAIANYTCGDGKHVSGSAHGRRARRIGMGLSKAQDARTRSS